MEVNREELAWAGGLFEGEGCISAHKVGGRISGVDVSLTTTDEDVLKKFHKVIGLLGTINGPYPQHTPDGRLKKTAWKWHVCNFEGAQAVIGLLWSWLGIRRKAKIKECLQLFHTRSIKIGRQPSLEKHVKEIRSLRSLGMSQTKIA